MTINGVPLTHYASLYNKFKEKENIQDFFKEVILHDLKGVDEAKKDSIISFLEKTFHQGGFMYPVSSALATIFKEYSPKDRKLMPYASLNKIDFTVHLLTTENGFKVQEFVNVSELGFPDAEWNAQHGLEEQILRAEKEGDYIIQAQGTIDLDFSKNAEEPVITVESNTISFGHPFIQNKLDNRNFGQRIADFFKSIFRLNEVKAISSDITVLPTLDNPAEEKPDQKIRP